MDALYHFLVLFILSIAVLLLRRPLPVALLLVIPVLTEILQVFMPGRTPALMDARAKLNPSRWDSRKEG